MARKILAGILGMGAVLGFASGLYWLRHPWHAGHGPGARRAAFEAHVAEVCTRAAERVLRDSAPASQRAP